MKHPVFVLGTLLLSVAIGCGGATVPTAPPAGAIPPVGGPSDWSTFADGLSRQGYNQNESVLNSTSDPGLHEIWSRDLGAAIDAQALFAANLPIGGSNRDAVYVGTEAGIFYALDALTGSVLWQASLGSTNTSCFDLPGGMFGITATATFDRLTSRVYVVDGLDRVHALDMSTGHEAAGWPVTIAAQVSQEHVYGALALNPSNSLLYVETAGYCDNPPYAGRLVALDTRSATVVATFLPAGTADGGGLWGMGGPSIAPTNDVFVATGNSLGGTANAAYAEHVVRLTPTLVVEAANYPGLGDTTRDYDFGSTPVLYQAQGCPTQLAAQNKIGTLYVYDRDFINAGPAQGLQMADNSEIGQFIGVAAFSPTQNVLYVGDPAGFAGFTSGLVALKVKPDCTLALLWQVNEGLAPPGNDNIAASIANDVVYSVNGIGDEVFANAANSGAPLWNSGALITGPVFAPPTVAGGRLYVGSWDKKVYAFGLR